MSRLILCIYLRVLRSTFFFFFFNDTATTEIYTLSLHDALPICRYRPASGSAARPSEWRPAAALRSAPGRGASSRSEEHTSELQSLAYLVCRLLLEKKKKRSSVMTGPEQPKSFSNNYLDTELSTR